MPAVIALLGVIVLDRGQYIVEDYGVVGWYVALEEGYEYIYSIGHHCHLIHVAIEVAHHAGGELLHGLRYKAIAARHDD